MGPGDPDGPAAGDQLSQRVFPSNDRNAEFPRRLDLSVSFGDRGAYDDGTRESNVLGCLTGRDSNA